MPRAAAAPPDAKLLGYLTEFWKPSWATAAGVPDTLRYDSVTRRFGRAGRRDGRRLYLYIPEPDAPVQPLPAQLLPADAATRRRAEAAYAAGFRYQLRHEGFRRRTEPVVTPEAIGKVGLAGAAQAAISLAVMFALGALVSAVFFGY